MSILDTITTGLISVFTVQPWYLRGLVGAIAGALVAIAVPPLFAAGKAQTSEKAAPTGGDQGDVTSNGGIAIGHGNSFQGSNFYLNPPPGRSSPTEDDLIRAVGTSWEVSPSHYTTAFKKATPAEIRNAVDRLAAKMQSRERSYITKLDLINANQGLSFSEKRTQLDRLTADFVETFQSNELPEARDLFLRC